MQTAGGIYVLFEAVVDEILPETHWDWRNPTSKTAALH